MYQNIESFNISHSSLSKNIFIYTFTYIDIHTLFAFFYYQSFLFCSYNNVKNRCSNDNWHTTLTWTKVISELIWQFSYTSTYWERVFSPTYICIRMITYDEYCLQSHLFIILEAILSRVEYLSYSSFDNNR